MKYTPFKEAVGLEHSLGRFSFKLVPVLLMGLPAFSLSKIPDVPYD